MDRKALVVSTVVAALFLFTIAAACHKTQAATPIAVKASGAPSIGKASAAVEVVLIEDFQCRNCRAFSKHVIPQIQAKYIQSGQVRFTLVPVSFLLGSQVIANAALEVHKQSPERFFPYLKAILNHEGEIRAADLVRMARRIGGIDLAKLQACIENGCHNQELNKNLNWAQGIMGGQFRTPTLYINGVPGSTFSFEAIQYQIDQILEKK